MFFHTHQAFFLKLFFDAFIRSYKKKDLQLISALCFQFRVFTAPFHRVEFADFWLADQLNSLVVVLMDLEYLICFYIFELQWNNSKGLLPRPNGEILIYVQILHCMSTAPLSD